MKVSERWLRTFINLPESIAKISEQLTNAGVEVDSTEVIQGQGQGQGQGPESEPPDTILSLKTPANRGDCLCMEGVARELSAINQLQYTPVAVKPIIPQIANLMPVSLEAKAACPRYIGRIIQNINPNAETPSWMQERLTHAGLRLVSPVVDVMNYVMLELGQPLHAFDLEQLQGEIVVRLAKKGETITTLDDITVQLEKDDLVIADSEKPQAIAGIMGGLHSSVTTSTTKLFLESAYFDPINIRRTAKRLNLRTDASIRFERGIDYQLQLRALERATQLLWEIVGGNVGPSLEQCDELQLPERQKLFVRYERIQALLGIQIENQTITNIFSHLEMPVSLNSEGFWVTVPSFRSDILAEEDLIEEIIRIYGYQHIPSDIPLSAFEFTKINETQIPTARIKEALVDRGYSEAITYSFVSSELSEMLLPGQKTLKLINPISSVMDSMRLSLWPGLIQALLYNQRRQQNRLRLFTVGTCFVENKSKNKSEESWQEKPMIALLASGTLHPEQWGQKGQEVDFFDVKADIEAIFELTKKALNPFCFKACHHPALHPGQTAEIFLDKRPIGILGHLHPQILNKLDLQGNVVLFECELEYLTASQLPIFEELSKYPSVRRDIAVIVDKEVLVEELKSTISQVKHGDPMLKKKVTVFDVYQGKGIEPTSKSVALGLILQHPSRTLVESEVNELMDAIVKELSHQHQAVLRE